MRLWRRRPEEQTVPKGPLLEAWYDLDWKPPPPVPELKMRPLGNEPDVLFDVKLRLDKVEDMVMRSGAHGARLKLTEVADEYQFVLHHVWPSVPIPLLNDLVVAFESHPLVAFPKKGTVDLARIQRWVGREVLCTIRYETWRTGRTPDEELGAWTVKSWRPAQ